MFVVLIEFEHVWRDAEPLSQLAFDRRQAAGHVSFGMIESPADVLQRPAGVLPQREHCQIFPFALIVFGVVAANSIPEVVRSASRENYF